jgi:hypothetical protein
LGAIRIVKIQNRRLGENIAGAETGGMIGIAFDLGRPAHVAFDE